MTDRVFERRFSEHSAFWLVCGVVLCFIYFYIFNRLAAADARGTAGVVWIMACVAMTGLSYLARRTKHLRSAALRRWTDRAGSVWLLFVLFSFFLMLFFDLVNYMLEAASQPASEAALAMAAAAAVIAFGIREAHTIHSTYITLPTDKLPKHTKRLRIVQLTDLHLGPYTGVKLLAAVLRRVREARPDMVVVTGDVADGCLEGRGREASMFRRIRPKYGFFAVTGNHDYYDNIDKAVDFMERSGMRVLHNEWVEAGGLCVIGVDDAAHLQKAKWGLSRSETAIVNARCEHEGLFTLLLRHRPVVEIGTEGMFDLQLSGHTHGGQMIPLPTSRLLIAGHSRGLKKLKNGSTLYTSNGAGYVGPPVRLMAPPEVVVIDLVQKEKE